MADSENLVLGVKQENVPGSLLWLVRNAKYLWYRARAVDAFGWPCGGEVILMGINDQPMVRLAVRRWTPRHAGQEGEYDGQSEYITKSNMHEHCSAPLTDAALELLARLCEQLRPAFDEPREMAYAVRVRLEPYNDEVAALLAAARTGDTVAAASLRDRGMELGRQIASKGDVTYFLRADSGVSITHDDITLHAPNPAEEGPLVPPQEMPEGGYPPGSASPLPPVNYPGMEDDIPF